PAARPGHCGRARAGPPVRRGPGAGPAPLAGPGGSGRPGCGRVCGGGGAESDGSPGMSREIRAPHGPELSCQGWPQEAALRMLMNNLDPEVAERPDDLVVYGGT